ncbi:hypothetical protein VTN00DRAFT_7164 [Thermoascus crustaceus]|uniref:uncharacterized protein n=1 Tax=Thermoascus crustaceus TaxID=5088 RepID=UPI003744500F
MLRATQRSSAFANVTSAGNIGKSFAPGSTNMATTTANVLKQHLALISRKDGESSQAPFPGTDKVRLEEVKNAPLFSAGVKKFIQLSITDTGSIYPQYGLIGLRLETNTGDESRSEKESRKATDNLVYANITTPWSTFICGSQGSGKSHTLSCLLENALLLPSMVGKLSRPLAAIIFHYDKFTAFSSTQLCEAAYLCSAGIPVRVLVSPSNFTAMKKLYSNMPGISSNGPKPKVVPLYFREDDLNISMMKTLMAVGDETPLYMEVVTKILREMAQAAQGSAGFNFARFKQLLHDQRFIKGQMGPLNLRLQLLESFLQKGKQNTVPGDIWEFKPGTLTVVDLSCPFVEEADACALFNICLSLFMERRSEGGRLVALDEAHKFLSTNTAEATGFTDTLLSLIRQQRHLATRVVIATQEPTLSPGLLDLCNVTIVHRFTSPAWYKTLEHHLAGALLGKRKEGSKSAADDSKDLFEQIVRLGTGEALLFCPTAMLDVVSQVSNETSATLKNGSDGEPEETEEDTASSSSVSFVFASSKVVQELGTRYVTIKVRQRVTTDGGRSILAE